MTAIIIHNNIHSLNQLFNLSLKPTEMIKKIYALKKQEKIKDKEKIFYATLAKYDEIQADYENLQKQWIIWLEKFIYPYRNSKESNIAIPIELNIPIEAIKGFEQFLLENWKYLPAEDKSAIEQILQAIPQPTPKDIKSNIEQADKILSKSRNELTLDNKLIPFDYRFEKLCQTIYTLVKSEDIPDNQEGKILKKEKFIEDFKALIAKEEDLTEEEIETSKEELKMLEEIINQSR